MFISGDAADIDPALLGPSGDQPTRKELGGMNSLISYTQLHVFFSRYDGAAETTYTYNLVTLLPEAGGASPFEGKRTGYAELLGCKKDGTSPVR